MSFNFKLYESTVLEDLGSVADIVGKKGKLRFAGNKNLTSAKRVSIVMLKPDGTSDVAVCSNNVSVGVRKALADDTPKNKILAVLSKLHCLENEKGLAFICAPQGSGGTESEFTVEELAVVKNVDYESIIAY